MTTDTTDSPSWVHRLGTGFTSLTLTALLFYIALALRLPWLLAGEWAIVDVGQQLDLWLIFSILVAVLFVPIAFGVFAGLRWFGVRPRYAWAGAAAASIMVLLAWARSSGGARMESTPPTTAEMVAIPLLLALFGALVVAGAWGGQRLTRVETPLQNRRVLVVGAVLVALVVAPSVIAAAVDEPGAEGPDADDWNSSGIGDTNESNDSAEWTTTTLGDVRCDESIGDVPDSPELMNYSVAETRSLPANTTVEYTRSGQWYEYRFPGWNRTAVINGDSAVSGDAVPLWLPTDDAVVAGATDSEPTRVWIDTADGQGRVVRYSVDLCPPPEA